MSKNSLLIFLSILGLLVTGACVSQRDSMIQQGYPPAYADGFADGCHSGKKAAGAMFDQFKKDVNRFQRDPQYAQGWSDGFKQCEKEQEALERQTQTSIQQQQLMEQQKHDKWEEKHNMEKDLLKGIDTKGLEKLEKK